MSEDKALFVECNQCNYQKFVAGLFVLEKECRHCGGLDWKILKEEIK